MQRQEVTRTWPVVISFLRLHHIPPTFCSICLGLKTCFTLKDHTLFTSMVTETLEEERDKGRETKSAIGPRAATEQICVERTPRIENSAIYGQRVRKPWIGAKQKAKSRQSS